MNKDKKLVPSGYYCYKNVEVSKDGKFKLIGVCPYWSRKSNRPKQEDGYCSWIGKGDYEINREVTIVTYTRFDKNGKKIVGKIQHGPDNPNFMSLLWDRCKELGCPKYK